MVPRAMPPSGLSGPGVWYNLRAPTRPARRSPRLNAPSGAGDTYNTVAGTQNANVLTLGGTWGPSVRRVDLSR